MGASDEGRVGLLAARTAIVAVGVGIIGILLQKQLRNKIINVFWRRSCIDRKQIRVIDTVDECQLAVNALSRASATYRVLGFDCEWVTVGGTRRPVALLQLSSNEGLCALFRLRQLGHIPQCLRDLLENDDVIKVGVGPQDDAQKLSHDYGVGVASTLDLRFLAALTNHKPEGLAKLAKALLNVQLDKHWRLACSDWEAHTLTDKQLHYAADDALVAVAIFAKLSSQIAPQPFWHFGRNTFPAVQSRLEPFYDVRFKDGYVSKLQTSTGEPTNIGLVKVPPKKLNSRQQTRGIATRSKALYDNCLLEAPDGELLCTIDRKKAQWYLSQQLGVEVLAEPFTVRLNFEPAGRAVGDVGRYYQTPKENRCVVCGRSDAYIRKNVVPREYRKNFPLVMKSHTSHDVLLLCPSCHQISNMSDHKVRTRLAEQCNAPITHKEGAIKCLELPELKQVRSAARALLSNIDKIPAERRLHLQQIVLQHYPEERELSPELLAEAANLITTMPNDEYCQHGERVTQRYESEFGGLLELERLWREHFLKTMQPKYLPELWNVNHNANRLEIRLSEGRVVEEDLRIAGLDPHSAQQS